MTVCGQTVWANSTNVIYSHASSAEQTLASSRSHVRTETVEDTNGVDVTPAVICLNGELDYKHKHPATQDTFHFNSIDSSIRGTYSVYCSGAEI